MSKLKILDFDIENRPLSYLGMDFTTEEITAIAYCFVSEKKSMKCGLLGIDTTQDIMEGFVSAYNEADMVTGHYIRAHDLPIINGTLLELGMAPLEPKLTQDTKLDLLKRKTVSASQENLAEMLGLPAPKVHMNTPRWRDANRLTPQGIALTKKRAEGDVIQHMQLRAKLVELGWLGPPKVWRP